MKSPVKQLCRSPKAFSKRALHRRFTYRLIRLFGPITSFMRRKLSAAKWFIFINTFEEASWRHKRSQTVQLLPVHFGVSGRHWHHENVPSMLGPTGITDWVDAVGKLCSTFNQQRLLERSKRTGSDLDLLGTPFSWTRVQSSYLGQVRGGIR
jgi:hypothetical protein